MTEKSHEKFFIKYSLEKAHNAIIEAEFNLNGGFLGIAANRTYYAIFYAITALGYLENFTSSKHHQIMGWFNKKFIYETKIFDTEIAKIATDAYENRRRSDYEISFKPVKGKVEEGLNKAKYFIDVIESYIHKNTELEN